MDVGIIKTKDDYRKAMQRLLELLDKNPIPGSPEDDELKLLVLTIKAYEQKIIEPILPDPSEAIKFRMEQMGLSRKELVPFFGSISKVSEVLSRKRNLSLTMIRRLHDELKIPLESLISKTVPRTTKRRKTASARK